MVRIGRFDFKGPFESPQDLENLPGIFAVISVWEGRAELIDIGTADEIRCSVEAHHRRNFWQRSSPGSRLIYAAAYTSHLDQQGRIQVEQELRLQYRIPCGAP